MVCHTHFAYLYNEGTAFTDCQCRTLQVTLTHLKCSVTLEAITITFKCSFQCLFRGLCVCFILELGVHEGANTRKKISKLNPGFGSPGRGSSLHNWNKTIGVEQSLDLENLIFKHTLLFHRLKTFLLLLGHFLPRQLVFQKHTLPNFKPTNFNYLKFN